MDDGIIGERQAVTLQLISVALEGVMFRDRRDAGLQLSRLLSKYKGAERALILALPRGGVPVAAVISHELVLPMNIFISSKLKAPWSPELALGAITETGTLHLNEE